MYEERPGMAENWRELVKKLGKMLVGSTLLLAGFFAFVWLVWAAIG